MERPILFSAEMVRAILGGRKTQTRRVINPQPPEGIEDTMRGPEFYEPIRIKNGEAIPGDPVYGIYDSWGEWGAVCPYGLPGSILWVREAWSIPATTTASKVIYKADYPDGDAPLASGEKWRSPIYMPREVARLFLVVKNVRVERLHNITEEDARAEGILAINSFLLDHSSEWCKYTVMAAAMQGRERPKVADSIGGFAYIWDRINAKRGYGWRVNPWVWVIEFDKVS
ncbi:MAG: hypothetical protein ACPL5F_01495 [Moorellaceae bacterium]